MRAPLAGGNVSPKNFSKTDESAVPGHTTRMEAAPFTLWSPAGRSAGGPR